MHVARLLLSHFRSHRMTRLALDHRPVVLFGANGSGKTNLLEAVSLLSPGRGLRGAAADALQNLAEARGWKLRAVVADARHPPTGHEIETWALPGQPRQIRLDGKPVPQTALGRVLRVLWLTPAMDRLWIEAAEGRRRFLDRLTLGFLPDHAAVVLAYDKAMRERNRLLRDEISEPAWHAAIEAQMARAGAAIWANRRQALARIARATEAAHTAFPAATLRLSGPDGGPGPETEADLATALAEGRRRDMAAGRSLTGPHRADLAADLAAKGMPAHQCSTGEQKALLISLVLAAARALRDDGAGTPLVLLDEVAAHLDADRRAALYGEILALQSQAWLTGTGPELFAGLGDTVQAFALHDGGGFTELAPAVV